jgi:hypothetical protein
LLRFPAFSGLRKITSSGGRRKREARRQDPTPRIMIHPMEERTLYWAITREPNPTMVVNEVMATALPVY